MKNNTVKFALITAAPIATMFLAHTAHADETYTVQNGDTLSSVAAKFDTSVDALAKANHLSNANQIYAGQQLTISTTKESKENYTPSQTQAVRQTAATPTPATGGEAAAKAWIANKESTNNYNARNGRYIGKYQLDAAYLNGDYSAANQERVAEQYVQSRYGSWQAAQAFHQANGWY